MRQTVVADIGTPPSVLERIAIDTWENDPVLWRHRLPQLEASGNKYSRGHALLVGGYPTTGAARMAARAPRAWAPASRPSRCRNAGSTVYAAALTSIMVGRSRAPRDLSRCWKTGASPPI